MQLIPDFNSPIPVVTLSRAKPNLRSVFLGDPPQNHIAKLAMIRRFLKPTTDMAASLTLATSKSSFSIEDFFLTRSD